MSKEDFQQQYMQFQMLQKQLEQLQEQLQLLQGQHQELASTKEHLAALGKTKPNTKSFAALAPGIYVATELKETSKVLINAGNGVTVYKTVQEAQVMVDAQLKDMQELVEKFEKDQEKTVGQLQELQATLSQLAAKQKE